MPVKIIILGAGGPGQDILGIIDDINASSEVPEYECVGFLDNDESKHGKQIRGVDVLGSVNKASTLKDDIQFVNSIGGPTYFWKVPDIVADTDVSESRFETLVHPSAYVAETATIGIGTVIFPQSSIYENTKIGNHVIIKDARVGHNTVIGDYTSVQGRAMIAGKVGYNCYIGMNSTIRGLTTVGDRSLVGMGAAVVDDVGPRQVVAGVPAQYLRDTAECND